MLVLVRGTVDPDSGRTPRPTTLDPTTPPDHLLRYFDYVDCTLHDFLNPSEATTTATSTAASPARSGLTLPQVRDLLRQLLAGVAQCHRGGVLHRNLKPKVRECGPKINIQMETAVT